MNKQTDRIPNHNKLPSLHKSNSKLLNKPQTKIPYLFFSQNSAPHFQQHPKNINQVKAHNFINQNSAISSPSLIFNLSDCIKKEYGKKFDASKQFSQENLLKSTFSKNFPPQKQNQLNKSFNFSNLGQQLSPHQNDKKLSFQRQQVLKLAQWIDERLGYFNSKKQIKVDDIIEYKNHILNYGLGKIIDSVRKKSKQQGELLRILWQNSFKIFEKVLEIVANSIGDKQKSYRNQQKEAKSIFDTNLNFLRTENKRISQQLEGVYDNMKRVIVWNKKLRKQRKHLIVQNRILQYRNQAYSQALEQTISMLLRSVPESSTFSLAKQVIQKLARQKRRKKKSVEIEKEDQDFKLQAKQMVIKWLKRNDFNDTDYDEINHLMYLNNDQKLQLTKIDDQNSINQVDIYEYFKLLDMGVQATVYQKDASCQYDIDTRVKTSTRGTVTEQVPKRNAEVQVQMKIGEIIKNEIQTININRSENRKNTGKFSRSGDGKKINGPKLSDRNNDKIKEKEKSLQKKPSLQKKQSLRQRQQQLQQFDLKQIPQEEQSSFNKIQTRQKETLKPIKKKDYEREIEKQKESEKEIQNQNEIENQNDNEIIKENEKEKNNYDNAQKDRQSLQVKMKTDLTPSQIQVLQQTDNKFYQKDFTIISEKKSQDFDFDEEQSAKNQDITEQFRISISKANKEANKISKQTSLDKNGYYGKLKGRETSIKDLGELNLQDSLLGPEPYDNNLKKLWQQIQHQKFSQSQASNSRMSVNFINDDNNENYEMKKLQNKSFSQIYEDQNINSRRNQKERQKLFQNVVRRRSFYKNSKVVFENKKDSEKMKETEANMYKSYIHYKSHFNKTIIEVSQEEEQKIDQISKLLAIPSNLAKSKTLQASNEMFKTISQACKKTKKQPPRNRQFFNSSLVSITKNITALIQDYVKQIKKEKDDIHTDFEKSYYPLHILLIDKMNWKYGLKDISGKNIKDFLEKILSFATVSEKVELYSLLLGLDTEGVGADELLIYLKSLVYFQKKQPNVNSFHIIKETNPFEKTPTEPQNIEENLDKVLKDFFDRQGYQIARLSVFKYLNENPKIISIQKISEILIRAFIKRKQLFRKDGQFLYKILSKDNNIFNNLYKILKIYNNYNANFKDEFKNEGGIKMKRVQKKRAHINISVVLREFVKRSDIVDQIYGRSISFERFLTAYMTCGLPKSEQFTRIFDFISKQFGQKYLELNTLKKLAIKPPKQNIKKFNQQNVKFLEQIQRKWQIKTNQKADEETWQWNVTKTVTQHIETNLKSVLGKLDIINNQIEDFYFVMGYKAFPSQMNFKQ